MSGVGRGSRATASSSDLALGACEKPGPSPRPQSGDRACFIFVSSELCSFAVVALGWLIAFILLLRINSATFCERVIPSHRCCCVCFTEMLSHFLLCIQSIRST